MKILFISYLFDPDPNVGAKRMSYWAQNFKDIEPNAEVHLITANPNPVTTRIDKVYISQNVAKPLLGYIIKDPGVAWSISVKSILEKIDLSKFTHVVFSGNPFMQFGLSSYIKTRSRAKIVLDYRDPFAVNPRFDNSKIKIWIKKWFEKSFNKKADKIISVNQYCLELLEGYQNHPEKFAVIRNGFDERSILNFGVKNKSENHQFELVYAGSFYADRNPLKLLKVLQTESSVQLCHIGKKSEFLNDSQGVEEMGLNNYSETLRIISQKNAGLIITSGNPFESTTKIYDYIAMKKPVFVITSGKEHTGAIEDELKNYPHIWCKNEVKSIRKGLEQLKELNVHEDINIDYYSRNYGLKMLIKLLKEM